MNYVLFPFLVVFFTTYSQIALRMRLKSTDLSLQNLNYKLILTLITDFWICSAIIALLMSFVSWSIVLSSDLNTAKTYPIVTSLTILIVSFLNIIFFQDKISLGNVLGGCMLLGGIYLILR